MTKRVHGTVYYGSLQRRLRDLLDALDQRLPLDDRRVVAELIDANECGLALQTVGDALTEESIPIEDVVGNEIADLAAQMGIPSPVPDRFRPTPVG